MTGNEYQALARRTQSADLDDGQKLQHALFGMASEVGEIHSIFQHMYQGAKVDPEKIVDECGDELWFMSELLDCYGIDLEEVMVYNINKLRRRYPEGFDPILSENRHKG